MTGETHGATAARSDRFGRLKLGAAILARAAVDAHVGFLSRDADFLSSARFRARLALELFLTKGALASRLRRAESFRTPCIGIRGQIVR